MTNIRIESLLSARQFVSPQLAGGRLYFVSNMSGRLSLYAMDWGGSVPEPLLPPEIALQNPKLMAGDLFYALPGLGKILVMLDHDGDENYQPVLIPLSGGYPEPAFGEALANYRVQLAKCDAERGLAYLAAESRTEALNVCFRGDLQSGSLETMGQSKWGMWVGGVSADHEQAILITAYMVADNVLSHWRRGAGEAQLLYGTPLEARPEGFEAKLNAIEWAEFTDSGRGLLFITSLFDDAYGLGYMHLDSPEDVKPVAVTGAAHTGAGEMIHLHPTHGGHYSLEYNIDGVSWLYTGAFDESALTMTLGEVVCGQGELAAGVLQSAHYDKAEGSHALSLSTATSPSQIYTAGGRAKLQRHTRERILGTPSEWLAPGEDASFVSFDGTRVSARLYLPAQALGLSGARPLVYYVHGGPQGQERPDFTWFSMPLIQFLTLNGFAVFVPNVRGSTGYGLSYTKQVDRDWGGRDRLDHLHAMGLLAHDKRVDTSRAAVMGRSYGGYMTLTLAGRHPELWSAACDMFGPYDLFTFMDRIPPTWKPYFLLAIGDPEKDGDFLKERSPRTYLHQIACPLLVLQGQNDPRVVEPESRQVVEDLRAQGKQVDYLVFQDEGHDVLKFENRVRCYNAITDFFKQHLA